MTNYNKIIKARLVVRGFKDEEIKRLTTDSPINSWNCHSLDVKTTFLRGNKIGRDKFIKPPKEPNIQGSIWKFNKVVYDLADTSRAWYLSIKDVLTQLGLQISAVP